MGLRLYFMQARHAKAAVIKIQHSQIADILRLFAAEVDLLAIAATNIVHLTDEKGLATRTTFGCVVSHCHLKSWQLAYKMVPIKTVPFQENKPLFSFYLVKEAFLMVVSIL